MSPMIKSLSQLPVSSNPVENWYNKVRLGTMKHVPIEAALSFPIPQKSQDGIILAAFYYGTRPSGGPGKGITLPPIALIQADYPSGRLLTFRREKPEVLFPGLDIPAELGPLVAEVLSPAERMSVRKELFTVYPSVLEHYSADDASGERQTFQHLFNRLIAPGLLFIYQQLNQGFFTWLTGG